MRLQEPNPQEESSVLQFPQCGHRTIRRIPILIHIVGHIGRLKGRTTGQATAPPAELATILNEDLFLPALHGRAVLRQQLKDPDSDGHFLGLSMFGVSPMQAIIELMTDEEFEPILRRWKTADWKTEYVAFITSAAKLNRFDLLDREFKATEDPGLRLLITISALENLATK